MATFEVGFTGTREGLKVNQVKTLTNLLSTLYAKYPDKELWLHHGDCIGADAIANELAKLKGYMICLHPPIDSSKRAFCKADYVHAELDYLIRNSMIVKDSQVLIGCPKNYVAQFKGSGTWSTIVKGQKKIGMIVYIIYPDGHITET